ncbi:MAG: copper-binding protein [Pseudomonadota bacterium]
MRTSNLVMLLAATLALTACGGGHKAEPMDEMAMEGHDRSSMGASHGAKKASVVGKVIAIDAEAGTITVDHEPVAKLGWPQMVMAFDAGEDVRADIGVGDVIEFTVQSNEDGNTITAMTKQ